MKAWSTRLWRHNRQPYKLLVTDPSLTTSLSIIKGKFGGQIELVVKIILLAAERGRAQSPARLCCLSAFAHLRYREREDMLSVGIEDEEKWLAEGIAGIQHNAFHMHQAVVFFNIHTNSFSSNSEIQFHWKSPNRSVVIDFFRLRTRTISEKPSNTPLRCSRSFELRSFHHIDITNSVNFSLLIVYSLCIDWIDSLKGDLIFFPALYVDLDMRAFDELRMLEIFFKDESRHGVTVVDLYELVQHAGNILPRLWVKFV